MRLKLNETQEELREDKKELGLSEDEAQRENVYGIELPILSSGFILIYYWERIKSLSVS